MGFWVNSDKLEQALNENTKTVNGFSVELVTIKSEQNSLRAQISDYQGVFKGEIEELKKVINGFTSDLKERSRPQWSLWAYVIVSMVGVLSAAETIQFTFFKSSINEAIAPLQRQVDVVQASTVGWQDVRVDVQRSREADFQSAKDRENLNKQVDMLNQLFRDSLASDRESFATLKSALVEIETQFCAEDSMRNLMHAQDLRTQAQIWQKAFPGTDMALSGTYYPQICNRNSASITKAP